MQNIQSMKQSVQKGFTLIELMIVVAIIGILAALAIPAYTDYTIKSRVSEGASLSGAAKTGIEVYWSENGTLLDGAGASITSIDIDFFGAQATYVTSVDVIDGPIIQVVMRTTTGKLGDAVATGGASGGCFEYIPAREPGQNIVWTVVPCSTNGMPTKYIPKI